MYEGGRSGGFDLKYVVSPHAAIGDRGQLLVSEHSNLHLHEDLRDVGDGFYGTEALCLCRMV